MKKFSTADYKQFIEEYCKINEKAESTLEKIVIYEVDIFNMSRNEVIDFFVYEICKKSTSIRYILKLKGIVSQFYSWCVEQGHIDYNPFLDEEFDDELFIFKSIEAMDIKVFYSNDVESLIGVQSLNNTLYEVLIRGFYEGIKTVKDFALLKYQDVNFENRTIYVGGRLRRMSKAFFKALESYKKIFDYEEYGHGANNPATTITQHSQYKDYVIKIKETQNLTDESYVKNTRSNIYSYFTRISKCAGYTVSYNMLYISGFMNYVKRICDKEKQPLDYYINLFYLRNSQRGFTQIVEIANEYGFTKKAETATEIRRICFPYLVKGKYYQ